MANVSHYQREACAHGCKWNKEKIKKTDMKGSLRPLTTLINRKGKKVDIGEIIKLSWLLYIPLSRFAAVSSVNGVALNQKS